MNALIFVIALLVIGAVFGSPWLALISIGAVFLTAIALVIERAEQQAAPAGGTGRKHKIIQASMDDWDNDDTMTYMMAMSGSKPISLKSPEDPMKAVTSAFGAKGKIPASVVRNVLPFSNYGRDSTFEHVFIGLPVSIGKLISKK
ncbi:MAG: hypothetical protein J7L23_03345 [Candidatus Diapherotrites archaeon]|nr:hypothetical protein [Candidatus Diapherotrites archaeon]